MKQKLSWAVALILFAGVTNAQASSPFADPDRITEGSMSRKFRRGVVNVVTCWAEVPRNVAIETNRTDPASGFFIGGVKGVVFGFGRFATGLYEVFTFPVPAPPEYAVIMHPEFVITEVRTEGVPGVTEDLPAPKTKRRSSNDDLDPGSKYP